MGGIKFPFADWEDFDSCVQDMMENEGYDEESANKICGSLEQESGEEKGNIETLLETIESGAVNVMTDLGLELVSPVKAPAQPSDWITMKSDKSDYDWKSEGPILVKQEETEKRQALAPALVPNTIDKEGDVVPTHVVVDAAHRWLRDKRGIDEEHNLIEGKGKPIESWTLDKEQTYKTVNDESKTYPKGTWMLMVEFEEETWKKIKEGELTGLSIYGKSEKIPVNKSENLEKQNDPDRICGYLWFEGTSEQREAFGDGTEGRGTDEKPPESWWSDCTSTIQVSELSEDQKELINETSLSEKEENKIDNMSEEDIEELKEAIDSVKDQVSKIETRFEEKETKEKLDSEEGIKSLLAEKLDEEKAEQIVDTLTEDKTEEPEDSKEEDEDEEDEDEKSEENPESKGYNGRGTNEEKKSLENETEKSLKQGNVTEAVKEKYEVEQ